MNIRSTSTRLAATLVATVLLAGLAGCGGTDKDAATPTSAGSSSVSAHVSEEPQVSPARLERMEDNGKPPKTNDLQTIAGLTRWSVTPGVGIDGALGNELGRRADAFLREHVLRRDRWAGKWSLKEGELDAYREKVTPELADRVETAVDGLEAAFAKHGYNIKKWPKSELEVNQKRVPNFGYLLLNTDTTEGGTGDTVYRVTKRQIFRGAAEYGWEGKTIGAPITFIYVDGARKNGTGQGKTFSIWQAWKKVKGEWLVFDAGYATL